MAVWCYMPVTDRPVDRLFCDVHVPRGCTCNHRYVNEGAYWLPLENPDMPTKDDEPYKWIEEGKVWCHVDEKGREYPCCEFWYDEDGDDVEEENKNKNT